MTPPSSTSPLRELVQPPPLELITPQALDRVARVDFMTFVERVFAEVDPGVEFEPGWHLALVASELAASAVGRHRRTIINLPPRSLKSIMASVALPAWMLGHNPSAKVLVVSYGLDLAEALGRQCRQVMGSAWYRRMFPATVISPTRSAAADFETTLRGNRLASSFGGAITGRGFDLIVIDDPIKPEEALSDKVRTSVNEYVATTLRSRFNQQVRGSLVLLMQRLHEDDLSGHLLQKNSAWRHVRLPAIAEEMEVWTYPTVFGLRTRMRNLGEALHPRRDSLQVLADIRQDVGEYVFAAQYQQRPAPLDGGFIKLSQFARYAAAEPPGDFDMIVQSWDTAVKTGELHDYSVCTTWGCKGRHMWLLAVHRRKLEFPTLKALILELKAQFDPDKILIEDTASGQSLIQDLIHDGVHQITPIKPRDAKAMRLMGVSSKIEAGEVHLPSEAPWLAAYEHELVMFPNGRHDDQVDSTTQALAWLMTEGRARGIFALAQDELRRMREEARADGEATVRIKGPPDCGVLAGITGREYMPGADGLFTVLPADAKIVDNWKWHRVT